MNDPSLATSADYADALLVARRAKHVLFLVILLMLLLQVGLFFLARYSDLVVARLNPTTAPTTQPAGREFLHYVSGVVLFLGTVLPILLSLVLLLIVHIMLVGRLIGVARVTSAFLWCLLLLLLMFPWQVFFGASTDPNDFRVPGVLYTWTDLRTRAKFESGDMARQALTWARFCVMPLVATILLLVVQIKSNRGLRQALG